MAFDLASDYKLSHVILLGKIEEASDLIATWTEECQHCGTISITYGCIGAYLGSTLRSKSFGKDVVCETGDIAVALLDDSKSEHSNVGADDAASDGFALPLTLPALSKARVTVGQEEANSVRLEDTLLHWEAEYIRRQSFNFAS